MSQKEKTDSGVKFSPSLEERMVELEGKIEILMDMERWLAWRWAEEVRIAMFTDETDPVPVWRREKEKQDEWHQ